MTISVSDISKLREQTGAGMLDCKSALEEANGDFDKAVELLRKKGIAKAGKRAGKVAAEGIVMSYIHGEGKIGVLVEVNSETDFVAKNEKFQSLAKDIAMHIAAAAPEYLSREEVPETVLEHEKNIYREQLAQEGKPEKIVDQIIEGKLNKFYSEVCLLDQSYIKDEDKTVGELLVQASGEIGEKVVVRRFARYVVGEGIEKEECDFAKEVEEQMGN